MTAPTPYSWRPTVGATTYSLEYGWKVISQEAWLLLARCVPTIDPPTIREPVVSELGEATERVHCNRYGRSGRADLSQSQHSGIPSSRAIGLHNRAVVCSALSGLCSILCAKSNSCCVTIAGKAFRTRTAVSRSTISRPATTLVPQ